MKIINIISQNRRDFRANMVCEGCHTQRKLTSGYDDDYYHDNVIPNMKCEACGQSRRSIIKDIVDKGEGREFRSVPAGVVL